MRPLRNQLLSSGKTAMQAVVVDASALGALVFGEREAEEMARRMSGMRLIAPVLIWFELANICVKKTRAHPAMNAKIAKAFDVGRNLPIEIGAVDYTEVVSLAMKTGLTAYDACYLWLSRAADAPLLTLDAQLLKSLA